jgi:ABC-type transporter Mla subunit MlaD
MKRFLLSLAGFCFIVAGIAGLIVSIAAIFALARIEPYVESAAMEQIERIDQALAATAEGLVLAEESIAQASTVLESTADIVADTGEAIDGAIPTIDAVSELLAEQLPSTIESTQETLTSAATSAKLVDDILGALTAIPLLGLDRYNPDVPLHQSLEDIAVTLDEIPSSLSTAEEGLSSTSGDLQGLGENITTMASDISQISANLDNAQSVLQQYQEILADLQNLVASVREGLPNWLRALQLGLTFILIWLGIVQIALITQGWELIERGRST